MTTPSRRWDQILAVLGAADIAAMYGTQHARPRFHSYSGCDCPGGFEDLCPLDRVEEEAYERLFNQADQ